MRGRRIKMEKRLFQKQNRYQGSQIFYHKDRDVSTSKKNASRTESMSYNTCAADNNHHRLNLQKYFEETVHEEKARQGSNHRVRFDTMTNFIISPLKREHLDISTKTRNADFGLPNVVLE